MSDTSQTFVNPIVGQRMQANIPKADGPGLGRIMVFRGLRVRMGMGTGVEKQEDIRLNEAHSALEACILKKLYGLDVLCLSFCLFNPPCPSVYCL